ncbi:MAG: hypothetical protein KAG37_05165 [Flavobacteriales bacterium]|nr:hypothetical protein [Flavobacteriales bacterium]
MKKVKKLDEAKDVNYKISFIDAKTGERGFITKGEEKVKTIEYKNYKLQYYNGMYWIESEEKERFPIDINPYHLFRLFKAEGIEPKETDDIFTDYLFKTAIIIRTGFCQGEYFDDENELLSLSICESK